MVKKAPRRTAERILEVTLELFNRFGEPNVSTTLISAELGISPGKPPKFVKNFMDEEFESGALKQFSRIAIQKTLEKTNGNVSLAAKLLRISRNTLYRHLKN